MEEQTYFYTVFNFPSRDGRLLGLQFSKKKTDISPVEPKRTFGLKQPVLS